MKIHNPSEIWKNAAKIVDSTTSVNKINKNDEIKKHNEEINNAIELQKNKEVTLDDHLKISSTYKIQLDNSIQNNEPVNFDMPFNEAGLERKIDIRFTRPVELRNLPKNKLELFDDESIYRKLSLRSLFFIFFIEKHTMRQYYCARILKNKGWRFNSKMKTWFQRLDRPRLITNKHEIGNYYFFNLNKFLLDTVDDFLFEYEYLENFDL